MIAMNRIRSSTAAFVALVAVMTSTPGATASATALPRQAAGPGRAPASVTASTTPATVWLCRPGLADDPCTASRTATILTASDTRTVIHSTSTNPSFDCFYVYPTVSKEQRVNADLRIQAAETSVATSQVSRFSQDCRVFAPMYRQATLLDLDKYTNLKVPPVIEDTAYNSLVAGFRDYLDHYNDGRPIIFIGHSQGAIILIKLLEQFVDDSPTLRNRTVLAILLGGDVEVPTGKLVGASFEHLPLCSRRGQAGCVIAYSSFPSEPPAASEFGRPGQGAAIQGGDTSVTGVQVACVNPINPAGGTADLAPFFPTEGLLPTPWVEFPSMYRAHCESKGGATWLQVTKITGATDPRPAVTESGGPNWGYHSYDVNLALGDLIADVSAAETSWSAAHPKKH
jgi:hypothetical protein